MKDRQNELATYKFSSFTEDMVRNAFELKQELRVNGYLTDWIKRTENIIIRKEEEKRLDYFRKKLKLFVRSWNEQELREKFITPIIQMVDFDVYQLKIASFSEREMKVIYKNSILQGKVEWMIAKGIYVPKQPLFFMCVTFDNSRKCPNLFGKNEKEREASNDPLGQLLVTLCSAQILNNQKPKPTLFNPNPVPFKKVPLYGIYIIGRYWFFVRLKDKRYYISKSYNAEEMDELIFILKMLKAQKEMIIDLVTN